MCEFSALLVAQTSVPDGEGVLKRKKSYRQNSQQRRLASILQTDHRDIHLGRPVEAESATQARETQLVIVLHVCGHGWKAGVELTKTTSTGNHTAA